MCLLFSSRLIVSSPVSSDANPCPDAIHLRCTSPQSQLVSLVIPSVSPAKAVFPKCLAHQCCLSSHNTCHSHAAKLYGTETEMQLQWKYKSSPTMKHEIMMHRGSHSNAGAVKYAGWPGKCFLWFNVMCTGGSLFKQEVKSFTTFWCICFSTLVLSKFPDQPNPIFLSAVLVFHNCCTHSPIQMK